MLPTVNLLIEIENSQFCLFLELNHDDKDNFAATVLWGYHQLLALVQNTREKERPQVDFNTLYATLVSTISLF